MINTKRFFLAITLIVGVSVLSFNESKDVFIDEYLEYYDALDNLRAEVKSHGDTASALSIVYLEAADLIPYEVRMQEESIKKWDSFETAWPGPPRNPSCHLECSYQWWRCRQLGFGDWLYCLSVLNECRSNC